MPPADAKQFTILHNFSAGRGNGRVPYGVLVPHGDAFYGTTTYGGPPYDVPPSNPANKGNVFRINRDGTGFAILHEFGGGNDDGWKPWSGLAILGETIYGSTVYGGPHGESGGVLYTLSTDGSGFRLLHAFGAPGDGYGGSTSPTPVGAMSYGMTRWGGNGRGTIYGLDTATGAYRVLHSFAADGSDGSSPLGTITAAVDGWLCGLTWMGGLHDRGTLFRIQPDGSAFETLHHFAGGKAGKHPYDSLAFDGQHTLYGTTFGEYKSDPLDMGAVFKFDLAERRYIVLHAFAGGRNDSAKPNGSVALSADGLTLHGTTHGDEVWGGKEFGILYRMSSDGSGFRKLYEFSGRMAGDTPMRTPVVRDGAVYGMTAFGGTKNYGTIYRFELSVAPVRGQPADNRGKSRRHKREDAEG